MSDAVFPALRGASLQQVTRSPVWSTIEQESVSGLKKEIANWLYPRWQYLIPYEYLMDDAGAAGDLQLLAGFFNARQGRFDTFLFDDPNDDFIMGQELGIGDGTTAAFQMVRAYGGFVEPCLNIKPSPVPVVYLNGAVQDPSTYAIGMTDSGVLTFTAAPAAGAVVTADFGYYWRCRFQEDVSEFQKLLFQIWSHKGIKIETVK